MEMGTTATGFICKTCEREFKGDAEFYTHKCLIPGWNKVSDFKWTWIPFDGDGTEKRTLTGSWAEVSHMIFNKE